MVLLLFYQPLQLLTWISYLCSENITSYDHFKGWADGMVCELYGDGTETAQDETEEAGGEQKDQEELKGPEEPEEQGEKEEKIEKVEEKKEFVGERCGVDHRYDIQSLERFYV